MRPEEASEEARTRVPLLKASFILAGLPALGVGMLACPVTEAAGPLPTPCLATTCGAYGPTRFVGSGAASATQTSTTLTVNQTTNQALLNWSSFNIAANYKVVFNQPAATSIALNRIYQASPSAIFGDLQANGQVYLVNLNGFIFGPTASVNVGSLLVSSLPMSDPAFQNGILSPFATNELPALGSAANATDLDFGIYARDPFAAYGSVRAEELDLSGKPILNANGDELPVQVVVDAGAQISAANGGRVLLAGQSVTNGGSLSAPGGQVVLAAGQQVYLTTGTDPSLRGLIVEVDSGGTAWNQLTGQISAPQGNVTLVGLAVNQDGKISATTSVAYNGSIRLEAADNLSVANGSAESSQGGTLTIGATSQMSILPEVESAATEVAAQTQLPSTVTLLGEQVIMQGGSINAPGGKLDVVAASDPAFGVAVDGNPNARLRIDPGTTINLAGSQATLPISANLVTAELRGTELANDPTQRNGALRGQTVVIDARQGSPPIADLSSEIAAVPENVAQRTETGGTAVFESEGDLVFAAGASINVSGGATTYLGGQMQTSYLVAANGQIYPIATASPLLTYVGVLNPTFSQTYDVWGVQKVLPTPGLSQYEPGYVQGAAAGSIQFAAPVIVAGGQLLGTAVNGPYQRSPSTAVAGGTLIIGLPGGLGNSASVDDVDYLAPAVTFVNAAAPIVVGDYTPLPGPLTLQLPRTYLTSGGFSDTQIYSNYDVTVPTALPLTLQPGSSFLLDASRVDILSSITAPSGSLSFESALTVGTGTTTAERAGIFVGNDVALDVRGQWTNDTVLGNVGALAPTWQNGGSITIGLTDAPGAAVALGNDVSLRASGGAWLEANGTIIGGSGGKIAIDAGEFESAFSVGTNVALDAFGVEGAAGGAFSLSVPRVAISNGTGGAWTTAQSVDDLNAPGGVFDIYAGLFSGYGFSSVSLNAGGLVAPHATTHNVLSVAPGTVIDAITSTLMLDPSYLQNPTGGNVSEFATPTRLPAYQRLPASVVLSAVPSVYGEILGSAAGLVGDVGVGAGASITTDVGGSITLKSADSILVDGALYAPGGTITLQVLVPGAIYDAGFLANQSIELGSTGILYAGGTVVTQPSDTGLSLGTVYAGGTINLLAYRGAVQTDPGSIISIAGTSAALDVQQPNGAYTYTTVGSAAGSMVVQSGEAISLLGGLDGAAGTGAGEALAAGTLSVALTRSQSWWVNPDSLALAATFATTPLTVELVTDTGGSAHSAANSNLAILGVNQIEASGIDALNLEAGSVISVQTVAPLSLGRALTLDSPAVSVAPGVSGHLSAPFVSVGYANPNGVPDSATAATGTGTLHIGGSTIDLLGTVVVQGAGHVDFDSSGDIELLGTLTPGVALDLAGSLSVGSALSLDAARIYPQSGTAFSLTAGAPGAGGTISIGQTNASPGTPLSAGGQLTLTADVISSTGTLLAPFGTISLNAAQSLTLGAGSVTSVSGDGALIPYGQTQLGGLTWVYASDVNIPITGVPARTVQLVSPSVTLAPKATVDLAGGGNLYAYEWVPGTGGETDALANGVTPGLYAVLPSLVNQSAPQDPQSAAGSTLAANSTIYLSGGGGLAAGVYPLLPARYALEPGAFLVQVEPGYQSQTGGVIGALADGTPIVAGYLSYGSTGLHQTSGYSGFAIRSGTYGQELASYNISDASTYFAAAASAAGAPRPTLPADAGTLSISVTSALDAAGTVLTAAASGGLGATIDLAASDLFVGGPGATAPAGAVLISGDALAAWKPGSLVLGGQPTANGGIDVLADRVTIGSGVSLTDDQIIVVAGQSIDVQSGASLSSTSAGPQGVAPAILPTATPVALTGAGDGSAALLAVSDLKLPIVASAAGTAGATVTIAGASGSLKGASVASRGALSIDGPGGVTLAGTLTGVGAAWSLASDSIALAKGTTSPDTLTISPLITSQLGAAGSVRLASAGSLDLLTPVVLGVSKTAPALADVTSASDLTLSSLTLSASVITNGVAGSAGAPGANASLFGARTIVLEGPGGAASTPVGGPSGTTLSFAAADLDVGPGTVATSGFSSTVAKVFGPVVGQGNGGLSAGGDLSIAATEVTVATGAQTTLEANGALSVRAPTAGVANTTPTYLAGDLTLAGSSIDVSGTVAAPAGLVTLISSGDTTIQSGATVSVAGVPVTILNQTLGAPGGALDIDAGGSLSIAAGATLDVSGAVGANAGRLALAAGDAAKIGGALQGHGGSGGTFSLDAGVLSSTSLSGLASALTAGGFAQEIDIRARTGDLVLGAGYALTANTVTLTADSGEVTVVGTISAPSASLRGTLDVFGGAGVELAGTGVLRADGAGATGVGGNIEIGTGVLSVDGSGQETFSTVNGIELDTGSQIMAGGAAGPGTLLLRAPALIAANDVAIGPIGANISSVGRFTIEPVLPFAAASFSDPSAPTAGDWANVQASIASYMAGAGTTIASRLGPAIGPAAIIEPGAEVVAQGSLTVNAVQQGAATGPTLDLSPDGANWRFGGAPVDLTVLATGNLTVAGTITDGFSTVTLKNQPPQTVLASGPEAGSSASIRLVAGADLTSANPLATLAGGSGTLTLGPGAVVRTGTGDIDLVAAGSVVVGADGAGAYTAGEAAIAPGGTVDNPYPNAIRALGTAKTYGIAVNPKQNPLVVSFPSGGGQLLVSAGEDVVGAVVDQPGVSNWQIHQGGTSYTTINPDGTTTSGITPAQWGVNLAAYDWNFGTLGGGDISISAGRDVLNVTAAASDSAIATGGATPSLIASGGLSVYAGRNIGSAELYLADGAGTVTANGALTAILPSGIAGVSVGSALFLQNSSLQVQARLGIDIDGIYNPTALAQPAAQDPGAPNHGLGNGYYTYGDASSVSLVTTAGETQLGGAGAEGAEALVGTSVLNTGSTGLTVLPGTLTAVSLAGDVVLGGAGGALAETMFPSATGQLELVAGANISTPGITPDPAILMSDAPLGSFPTASAPAANGAVNVAFGGLIHTGDTASAIVTAGLDINELSVSIPKATDVEAGQDIVDLVLAGQNLNASDTTLVSAGRDLIYQDTCGLGCGITVGGPGQLEVMAGRNVNLAFSSGVTTVGDILNPNLPTSQGADLTVQAGAATGSNYPAALADLLPSTNTAANLQALSALPSSTSADFASHVASFLTSVVESSPAYEWEFQYFVRNQVATQTGTDPGALTFAQADKFYSNFSTVQQAQWLSVLGEFMQASVANQQSLVAYVENATGNSNLTIAQALTDFASLGTTAQRPFVDQVYFEELGASGNDDNLLAGVGFSRGNAAIDALFPGSRTGTPGASESAYFGDISLVFSRVYTLSGGNVSLLAPGGMLNVGLANPPAVLSARSPSTLGIVSEGSGDVSIYTQGDVDVNASRVFTLGGGNILIWSNQGSIDAGRGAKAAVSAPPPQVLIASDGTVTLDFSGAATGSGIRTIQTDPTAPLGDVELIAPVGTVNAGDAGIGAAGNLTIAAQHVLGLDNIQVGGTSTGVPAQVSSLGATLASASTAGSSSTQAASESVSASEQKQAAAPLAQSALGWLDVFVIGLGEEDCKPEDAECLKRQKKL